MSQPRIALLIVLALASPMTSAQSIKPMSPAEIAQIGSPASAPAPAPAYKAPAPTYRAPAPAPAPAPQRDATLAPPPATTYTPTQPQVVPPVRQAAPQFSVTTIPAGSRLSEALDVFVSSRGWSLRWLIEEDYMLDADLPIPGADVIDAVTWVVQTYQRQGGLRGVVPRFARGNRVVAIEQMDVRDTE